VKYLQRPSEALEQLEQSELFERLEQSKAIERFELDL